MKDMIEEGRQNRKQPGYQCNGDFMSILLEDEMFRDNDQMIVDECITFLFAGSQTTSLLLQNAFFRLTQNNDCNEKVREEITKNSKGAKIENLNKDEWARMLTYDSMDEWQYVFQIIQETLRIDPSLKLSSTICLTETVEICGVTIKAGDMIGVNMHALHHSTAEWQQPESFLPERFDPKS